MPFILTFIILSWCSNFQQSFYSKSYLFTYFQYKIIMSDDEFFDYGSDSGNVSPEPDPESDLDDIYDDVIGEEPSTSRRYV